MLVYSSFYQMSQQYAAQ